MIGKVLLSVFKHMFALPTNSKFLTKHFLQLKCTNSNQVRYTYQMHLSV